MRLIFIIAFFICSVVTSAQLPITLREFSGSSAFPVSNGTQYRLAYYAATGGTVSNLEAITAGRVLISDANGLPTHSVVTPTELAYLSGTTSTIQTQFSNKQGLNADLTSISGLTPSNDDILQRKAGAWTNRTIAQLKTDLSISGSNTGDQDLSVLLVKASNLSDLTNAATARTNLGATTVGGNLFTLANPSAISFARINADNTVTARTPSQVLADIGAQASDADLTTIAGLTATTDNFIVSVSSAWASRTPSQVKTVLTLNNVDNTSDATKNSASATITNKTISFASNTIQAMPVTLVVAASDEATALTTGTGKVTFRMPHAMTVTGVRASLTTASSSGLVTVNVKENGTTIFSTQLTIDANEKTSTTAATAMVLSDTALADDSEITIDIVGAGTGAIGLKVSLIGTR